MIRFGISITISALALVLATGCGGDDDDDDKSSSSSGGGGSSSSGGGGSSSGGTSSGGASSSSSSGGSTPSEPAKKDIGGQCEESADCKSDFCVFSGGGKLGMCTQTCDDSIDCPGLGYECVRLSDAPQKVCVPE